jgi:threonine dehydratase
MITFDDVLAARERIGDAIYYSPCPRSVALSQITGCDIYCKMDYLQRTGSFKERGARNALLLLDEEQKQRGVVAASAGNHALGLAYHGQQLNIPVTVVMPRFAPLIKITIGEKMGAIVLLHGETFAEAEAEAHRLEEQRQLAYVHGFNDPAVIAGQGTMGLEILEQVPDVEAIVLPVGGAGLIAGVALAVKSQYPDVLMIGVEPQSFASYSAALQAGHPESINAQHTLADGLAVPCIGENSFALAKRYVDSVVTVSEDALALAILRIAEMEKGVVEGAAAAPLAALLEGRLPELKGKQTVLALAGGNIDPATFCRVIEKGLVADGRLHRFTASISDRPGGLAEFTKIIADTGASVKDITHDRAFSGPDTFAVNILAVVETRDEGHIYQLHGALREHGIPFQAHTGNENLRST